MLDIVHQAHMGTEKCLLRAKVSMFWPGFSKDIKELIAKLLNQREYRTLLPCSGRLQRTQCNDSYAEWLQHRQDVQEEQHDKSSSDGHSELSPRQHVVVYQPEKKSWTPAKIESKSESPRSYIVRTSNGSVLRRNRIHLKPDLTAASNNRDVQLGDTETPSETTEVWTDIHTNNVAFHFNAVLNRSTTVWTVLSKPRTF